MRVKGLLAAAFPATVLALVACSNSEYPFGASSFGASPTAVPTVAGTTPTTSQSRFGECPLTPPSTGYTCSGENTCEYGASVDVDCNVLAVCNGRQWRVFEPLARCKAVCPSEFESLAAGTACEENSAPCTYFEATCGCVARATPLGTIGADSGASDASDGAAPVDGAADADADADADQGDSSDGAADAAPVEEADAASDAGPALSTARWVCVTPTPGCPARRPLLGSACVLPMSCDYGSCLFGERLTFECYGGKWERGVTDAGPCP